MSKKWTKKPVPIPTAQLKGALQEPACQLLSPHMLSLYYPMVGNSENQPLSILDILINLSKYPTAYELTSPLIRFI